MSDLYSEFLVKKEPTSKDAITKYGLIGLTVLAAVAGLLFNFLFLLAAVVLGIACYFIVPKTDLEYEYLFVNGEMDIDMVMAKSKRKKAKTVNIKEADLVAPLDSHRLDYSTATVRGKHWTILPEIHPTSVLRSSPGTRARTARSLSNRMKRCSRLSKIQPRAKFFWIDTVNYFC